MSTVAVVVVAYNSRGPLRDCVAPLAEHPELEIVVADNGSSDGSAASVADLPIRILERENDGFAGGCNAGWRASTAPYVFFLNPDTTLPPEALLRLVETLESDARIGLVAPKIVDAGGELDRSLRLFPRLGSTFAQAFFLHRLFPRARWADDRIRDAAAYERPVDAEWVPGTAMLLRRETLERLGGFDDRFFMYCEDMDLCARIRAAGLVVRFDPSVVVVHEGGHSAPRPALFPVLTRSRLLYAEKHFGPWRFALERLGICLRALSHVVATSGGAAARRGHLRSLRLAARPLRYSPNG